jgi:hypothetical protein
LIHSAAPNAKDFTNQRTRRNGVVNEVLKARNRNKSKLRARVMHVFGAVKRLWGFGKVRIVDWRKMRPAHLRHSPWPTFTSAASG